MCNWFLDPSCSNGKWTLNEDAVVYWESGYSVFYISLPETYFTLPTVTGLFRGPTLQPPSRLKHKIQRPTVVGWSSPSSWFGEGVMPWEMVPGRICGFRWWTMMEDGRCCCFSKTPSKLRFFLNKNLMVPHAFVQSICQSLWREPSQEPPGLVQGDFLPCAMKKSRFGRQKRWNYFPSIKVEQI